ncbi:MAG: hypothetical protein QX197_01765 [Methylococcaceae bacterium]
MQNANHSLPNTLNLNDLFGFSQIAKELNDELEKDNAEAVTEYMGQIFNKIGEVGPP